MSDFTLISLNNIKINDFAWINFDNVKRGPAEKENKQRPDIWHPLKYPYTTYRNPLRLFGGAELDLILLFELYYPNE